MKRRSVKRGRFRFGERMIELVLSCKHKKTVQAKRPLQKGDRVPVTATCTECK
jgi:hypothetical protein